MEQVKDADLVVKQLDLASLESVRACAKDINETESRLDILINNAGNNFTVTFLLLNHFNVKCLFTDINSAVRSSSTASFPEVT